MEDSMVAVLIAAIAVAALSLLYVIYRSTRKFKFEAGTLPDGVLPSDSQLRHGLFDEMFRKAWTQRVSSKAFKGVAPGVDWATGKEVDSMAAKYEVEEQSVKMTASEVPGVTALSPEELVEDAARLHRAGVWYQAAEHYASAVELYYQVGPMAAECRNQRGACLTELAVQHPQPDAALLQSAVDEHSKAIELQPTMITAWHNRGNAYFRMNRLDGAIADFERSLALEYSEETERLLTQARQENSTPDTARVLLARAMEAYQSQRYMAAKDLFADALDKGHLRLGQCYTGIARCHAALNQHKQAIESYSVAIEHDGTDASAWRDRAKSKAVLGRIAEAKAEENMAAALLKKFPKGGHTGVTIATTVQFLRERSPNNICLSSFDPAYFNETLKSEQSKKDLLRCMRSGIENPDSSMGCYACQPEDYDRFKPFFSKALAKYHGVPENAKHVNDWSLEGVEGLPEDGVLDIAKLGLPELSMRVRVGRNLKAFPLPGAMTKQQRCDMENFMLGAFAKLIAMPEYGGKYCSFTPGHPNYVDTTEYQELVDAHIAFKDMSADRYLVSAGIAADWPHGRGVYVSADRGFIIWVGEEDHLRIMCMEKGTVLNKVFDRLKAALDVVNGIQGLEFAISPDYGVVTSCPTNLGTGMRASLHIQLPYLTADGTDAKAKAIAKPLGLSVRGLGGEHTPIGADGTVDISPSARFCIKECEIITALYLGIEKLKAAEDELASPVGDITVQVASLTASNSDNICLSSFDPAYWESLSNKDKADLERCMRSGIENPDSSMGCYACQPEDYDRFKPFFSKALAKYHGVPENAKHVNDWSLEGVEGLPEDGVLDIAKLGLPELSMRVRVGRNLKAFPLPGAMTKQQRCDMENFMLGAFAKLIAMPEYGGKYCSFTPGHPNYVDTTEYQELVDAHIAFKDMSADRYLVSAGIAADWPHGRGVYVSADRGFIIWVGEEDHLRIMCMEKGTVLNKVFDRLKAALDVVNGIQGLEFAISPDYGVVTSCPTNLGTGMRASLHIQLPYLTADGTDAKAKAIAKPLGLSVRGLGGEHTPIGADGTVDISPSARFCIKECEIITALYLGIEKLKAAEDELASPVGDITVQVASLTASNSDNICLSSFDPAYWESLSNKDKVDLERCMRSGIENPDSSMGCYACQPEDYDRFKPFFSKALAKYHGVPENAKHVNDWSLEGVEGLPEDGVLDIAKLGLPELSMRVRVGRNLKAFPLPGAMTKQQRCDMENFMLGAFAKLIAMPEYGGKYCSFTPGHPNYVDTTEYQELVDAHIAFKDMSADRYLVSAGIAADWPHGRGVYVSADRGFIIWVGEEDHLRIMCMEKGTVLNKVFDRLKAALDVVNGIQGLEFAISPDYGVVTSCPTNLGTGMRASLHIQLPYLTADGTDAKAKAIAKPLGLSVRGLGGEHTPIGADGTVDISPSARFCIKECEIITALYLGIEKLKAAEDELASPVGDITVQVASLTASNSDNICLSSFDPAYWESLSNKDKAGLERCMRSGIENPDSSMGCYACQPEDYDRFKPFFSKALAKYHGVPENAKHVNDWSLEGVEGLPEDGVLDIAKLGLPELSMRVRVGRNLKAFPLPGAMTKQQRCDMENFMLGAFAKLIAMPEYGGKYCSFTPGHPNYVDTTEYQELVDAHIAFKDMSADRYLVSAGIAADWPHGRGVYVSADRGFIIWVGEEDHLRIMCMEKGTVLNKVFDRLKAALDVVNGIQGLEFAISPDYGVVTSCPTNLGTGMRASLHIQLPYLTADGTDAKAKAIAKPLGLSVRGLGGEHTPIGADGTVDISPSARFCIKECEIITALYLGIEKLKAAEDELASPVGDITVQVASLTASNSDNICLSSFDPAYWESLSNKDKAGLERCMRSGIENPDSSMGCYACQPEDYDRFKPFFSKALAKYHGVPENAKHVNDWSLEGVEGLPEDGVLDIAKLGLPELSMRVRVGRNLKAFPLPGAMTKQQRCDMENFMLGAFAKLIAMPEYGGKYCSFTPGHPNYVDTTEYQELVDAHIAFKDMSADRYLVSAGIAADWPHGRGVYVSADRGFIIWVGEEDHLRIMCMEKGTVLNKVFDRLKAALDVVNGIQGLEFAISPDYGVVTSCPTNLGTGMRASLHIQLPYLTADGTDAKAKAIAKPLGLSVRGLGGEHTPIGADGTVDISPSARFCIKECEIITALYLGIEKLKAAEDELASPVGDITVQVASLTASNSDNICLSSFDPAYWESLSNKDKAGLERCMRSGIENPDSSMGCYACQPEDYDRFKPFFSKALAKYHGVPENAKHVNDWSLEGVEGLPEDGVLDIAKLGLPELSMRVRVGRNLKAFPLPGAMTKQQRCDMENFMLGAFAKLIAMPEYGGKYCSFTPGHPNYVDTTEYQELVDAHIAFKDMSADRYLVSAGIAADWPHGRGVYVSADRGFIIWVGEEDHLRIMCMEKGTVLNKVFDRLKAALDVVNGIQGLEFAISPDYGVVTSCPTNLGTGMRASLHIQLPYLTADGTDAKAKAIAKPLGLSVRGLGGEHTPIGADGTVDISPSARFCIKECEIIARLYEGIENLKIAEDEQKAEVARLEQLEAEAAQDDAEAAQAERLAALEREQDAQREEELRIAKEEADVAAIAAAEAALQKDQEETARAEAYAAKERRIAEEARQAADAEARKQAIQDEINAALTEEIPFIKVDGHAKGTKNTPYLQKLSQKRAVAVKDELTRQGIRADHIKHKGSGAAGRGMHVFITVDHIDENERPQNVSVGNDLSRLTADEELKNRIYSADDDSRARSSSRIFSMMEGNLSPAQQAKQAELENKIEGLRTKMRAAMIKIQATKAASNEN